MISKETFPAPLRSTLAATDLTNDSLPALEAAHVVTPEESGSIHVIHCLRRLLQKVEGHAVQLESDSGNTTDRPTKELEHQVEHHIRRVLPSERSVKLHLWKGTPHRAITRVAEEADVDLIVLGKHQPRYALDGLMGTTADRVLRTTSQPCLVLNRTMPKRPRRIVVPSDLSPHSDRALALTAAWAQEWNAVSGGDTSRRVMIELVNISAYASPSYRVVDPTVGLRRRIDAVETITNGTVPIRPRIQSAPLAPDGIRRIAEESDIDMIVMGTHGHGFVMRSLIGSVATEIVRSVRLPIVVVPPPKRKA